MDRAMADELREAGFQIIETHISRVFLRGPDVYKCKRPVSLGFLDFSTLAARLQACTAEVALNRRLAPDVYLGVVALVREGSGKLHFVSISEAQEALDWAVHMRRLPDEERADKLLEMGRLGSADVERLARQIAAFHRAARSDEHTRRLGGLDALTQNVRENFVQLAELEPHLGDLELIALRDYQLGFLQRERERFLDRERDDRIRDGHGDLRLEHCYRGVAGFLIIDCIEFNDRFRYADVCADLSFLTMDLRHSGRPGLADLLLAAYARESRDYSLYGVLDFYESYRATVRGKVMAMLAQDSEVERPAREHAAHEAHRYLVQALSAASRPLRRPTLYVTFGLIASGKSTVARALALREGAAQLCADEVRKELLGVAPTVPQEEPPFVGAYAESMTQRVYDELFARASHVLASGRSVVLDASFRSRAQRARALAVGGRCGADVLFLECRVAREVALARLTERARRPHVSDGRAEIYDAFAATFEPSDELPRDQLVVMETTGRPEVALDVALGRQD